MSASRRRLRGPSPLPDDPIVMRHQRFIRSLPCLSCGKPAPSECAYVGMLPGLGIVPGHRDLVPLCGPATVWQDCCHSRKHYRGAARFWAELGIDPIDLAFQLWRVSGDVTAGHRVVARARQPTAINTEVFKLQRGVHRAPRLIAMRLAGIDCGGPQSSPDP